VAGGLTERQEAHALLQWPRKHVACGGVYVASTCKLIVPDRLCVAGSNISGARVLPFAVIFWGCGGSMVRLRNRVCCRSLIESSAEVVLRSCERFHQNVNYALLKAA
jgi:hypothetical protein